MMREDVWIHKMDEAEEWVDIALASFKTMMSAPGHRDTQKHGFELIKKILDYIELAEEETY